MSAIYLFQTLNGQNKVHQVHQVHRDSKRKGFFLLLALSLATCHPVPVGAGITIFYGIEGGDGGNAKGGNGDAGGNGVTFNKTFTPQWFEACLGNGDGNALGNGLTGFEVTPLPAQAGAKNGLTAFTLGGYSGRLSKSNSVTPQRHCGFFAPAICPASQAVLVARHSAAAAQLRLQSVYDGMTRQNTTPLWGNMPGGSIRPRVNPVTHSDPQPEWAITQKRIGANHG